MKLIHTADLHLDSKLNANLGRDKAKERRSEILYSFVRLVQYAAENDVSAILISGDLFDTRSISATARNTVYDAIKSNKDLQFYILKGNHDKDNFLSDIDDLPDNLHLFGNAWTTYRLGNRITISGIELYKDNSATYIDSMFLNNEDINIVMLHGQDSVSNVKDKAEVINIKALRNKSIDYLALGHVHSFKEEFPDARMHMVYPGCLDPRGFDETGEHGFVLLDIDEAGKNVNSSFVPWASRYLHEVNVDVSGLYRTTEMIDKISSVLDEAGIPKKDLVKIVLKGEVDVECEKDAELIYKHFESSFWFLKVYDKTGLKVNIDSFMLDKSLKGEFVRTVLADNELSDEEKAYIIRYGLTAISGGKVEECD